MEGEKGRGKKGVEREEAALSTAYVTWTSNGFRLVSITKPKVTKKWSKCIALTYFHCLGCQKSIECRFAASAFIDCRVDQVKLSGVNSSEVVEPQERKLDPFRVAWLGIYHEKLRSISRPLRRTKGYRKIHLFSSSLL